MISLLVILLEQKGSSLTREGSGQAQRERIIETMNRVVVLILFILFLSACNRNEIAEQDVVLARIGDDVITVNDFLLNYEFGHAHLRTGDQAKKDYLNFMIYEALMAQKAEELRLDTLPNMRNAMNTLREELLIERVFQEKVLGHIEVSQEEVEAEINKAAVSFKFRFMPASSKQDADQLFVDMKERGFEVVLEERKEEIPELSAVEGQLQSPYVKADEIDVELLNIIQDLELNTPSSPAMYRGQWYIFEVQDIRRIRLAPEDYENKSSSYEKVIYNRKALEQGGAFIAQTMEPLDVRTKRAGFDVLESALWDWYNDEQPESNLRYYMIELGLDKPYIQQIIENYAVPLVEFSGDLWTIETFVTHFSPGRYIMTTKSRDAFKARLADVVALVVRDHVLLDIASEESMDDHAAYTQDIRKWELSWLSLEYKKWLVSDSAITWNAEAFRQHADELLKESEVSIRWGVLDTLRTSIPAGSPGPTVHLLKSNSNKRPFPIVDAGWKAN